MARPLYAKMLEAPVINNSLAPKPNIGYILSNEKSLIFEKDIIKIATAAIGAIIELHLITVELPNLYTIAIIGIVADDSCLLYYQEFAGRRNAICRCEKYGDSE